MTLKTIINNYLLGCLNSSNELAESANCTPFLGPLIDQFDFCPYTPQVLEQCTLITLGNLGLLTEFSTSQLNTWILEIWGKQQADGGFGTCFTPNSTIVETFLRSIH